MATRTPPPAGDALKCRLCVCPSSIARNAVHMIDKCGTSSGLAGGVATKGELLAFGLRTARGLPVG